MRTRKNSMQHELKGLRDAMFEEFDALCNGTSTPQQAMAKAAIAGKKLVILRKKLAGAKVKRQRRAWK